MAGYSIASGLYNEFVPVILMDKDPDKLVQKYLEINTAKEIIGSYSINDQHCLVILVKGNVKINRRNKNG